MELENVIMRNGNALEGIVMVAHGRRDGLYVKDI